MKNIISNKKIMLTLFSIVFVVICMIGTSYAVFFKTDTVENNVYTTGVLEITASSTDSAISLANAMPMSDSDGAGQDPYTFTITNTGDFTYTFDVMFLSTTLANAIDSQYIKVMLDSDTPVLLSSLTNGILKGDVVLKPGRSINFNLRIWLSLTTPNTQIGKTFTGKITTNGEASEYVTLANHIISLATTNTDEIRTVTHEAITTNTATGSIIPAVTDYRYYSADENADEIPDPTNNYIYYNCTDPSDTTTCEIWRIIGVFYDELTDSNRVKIINENINTSNNIAWDTGGVRAQYGVNAWTATTGTPAVTSDATINTYLNGTYYDSLSASAKALTANARWYLGGQSTSSATTSTFYTAERGKAVYSGDGYTRATYWNGTVGLMYPSDYGYAASSSCATGTNLFDYYTSCKSTDWLYNSSYVQWTMSPNSGYSGIVFNVYSSGRVYSSNALGSDFAVRPVLYLISEAEFVDGDGRIEDPFVIN